MFAASLGFWKQPPVEVSGGTVTFDGAYTIRTFTSSGNLVIRNNSLTGVQYLQIAGGGAAYGLESTQYRAGGGAGGVIQMSNVTLAPGTFAVTVGGAGANTVFNGQTAIRGGAAGLNTNGQAGGSGGGGGVNGGPHPNFTGGAGTAGQGRNGGAPYGGGFPPFGPGGGGGAGAVGQQGGVDGQGGSGGIGIQSSITGVATYYAGGGTGWGPGSSFPSTNLGVDNYGGGGTADGPVYVPPKPGVLIIRYLTDQSG